MSTATRRPGRFPRVVLILVVCLAVFALAGSLGTAWYFSNQLIQPEHGPGVLSETVESVHTLPTGPPPSPSAAPRPPPRPGRYSLYWPGGNAMLGPIVAQTPNQVTRILLSGDRPTAPSRAGMSWTYSPDPKTALNLDYSEIEIPTPLGPARRLVHPRRRPAFCRPFPADKSARLRISTASAPTLEPPDTSPIAPAVTGPSPCTAATPTAASRSIRSRPPPGRPLHPRHHLSQRPRRSPLTRPAHAPRRIGVARPRGRRAHRPLHGRSPHRALRRIHGRRHRPPVPQPLPWPTRFPLLSSTRPCSACRA